MEQFFDRLWRETGAVDIVFSVVEAGSRHRFVVPLLVGVVLVMLFGVFVLVRRMEKRHLSDRQDVTTEE